MSSPTQSKPETSFPPQHQDRPGIESQMRPRPQYYAKSYTGANKLKDKVAFITGGDSGIGRAVAVLFAREGADIALAYLPQEESDAEETIHAVEREGRRAIGMPGDIKDADFCKAAIERTVKELGHLAILVNNAAFQKHVDKIEDLAEEQWELTFRTNVLASFRLIKLAVAHMTKGGVILNTGSITGLEGSAHLLDYSATKGALHALTKSLAKALLDRGIRVNCIAPGPVWTPLNVADQSAEKVAEFGGNTPFKRPAQPEEIAPAYVFLAAESDSSYITGEILTLLGGDTTAA